MSWLNVGEKIISAGCPILGAAVGGVPGIAIKLACAAFNVLEDPKILSDAIDAHPDSGRVLKNIEKEHGDTLIKEVK